MFREKIRKFHFVGIGGMGMSGIAQVLIDMGYHVSGSDIKEDKNTELLRRRGARISIGHKAENVGDVHVVVYSSAVTENNPELLQAKNMGIPIISRGEMLAELFRLKEGIAVCGSHGKTTTTSMIAHIVHDAGYDPTVLIGGVLHKFGSNARLGSSELIVSEADESDGSFLRLFPTVAVVTNIDAEHMDYYKDIEDIKEAFLKFANSIPFYGFCVMNLDDKNSKEVMEKVRRKVITFGIEEYADIIAHNLQVVGGTYRFDLSYHKQRLGYIHLSISGKHNVYNALASIGVALNMDISFDIIKHSLENFKNAERRLELKGYFRGCPVYDDYGHHPTEMLAVMNTIKELHPDRRILLVFQPHRYSRIFYLFDKFCEVLRQANPCFLTDIYSAGEQNVYGVSSQYLAEASECIYARDKERLFEFLEDTIGENDVILFMGAGNISKWCEEFLHLERK
ncbi:MAG: UDP-N-acetylmuramate--L-alanine ligase [Aquificaceae bacterium]